MVAAPFLRAVAEKIETMSGTKPHSKLSSLLLTGRDLQNRNADIIHEASSYVTVTDDDSSKRGAILKGNKENNIIVNISEQGVQER